MSHAASPRAGLVVLVASALIGAGAAGLYWPTTLDAHDRWGFPIGCGSGFSTDYGHAAAADHDAASAGQGYVAECQSAITWRRVWATSLTVTGAVGVIALNLRGRRTRRTTTVDD
jgi:hypothetical protein